ncbi:hypothetical protein ACJJIK_12655 [Microbulbifer sp. ZKSA006]|uniref:hypothetical protein n=1 Tax=Microbulbifer sp. ZKSA006 TaxID=3243390 RepID=UPI0040392DE9
MIKSKMRLKNVQDEMSGKAIPSREPLNNAMRPLVCRAVHNRGAASPEYLGRSRSHNAVCESH